jgi:DHA1 family multidrug resistance protein-like MFS transporter
MFLGMEIQWAATLLGCVAAVLIPVPVFFSLYGPRLRQKSQWAPTPKPASPVVVEKAFESDESAH